MLGAEILAFHQDQTSGCPWGQAHCHQRGLRGLHPPHPSLSLTPLPAATVFPPSQQSQAPAPTGVPPDRDLLGISGFLTAE